MCRSGRDSACMLPCQHNANVRSRCVLQPPCPTPGAVVGLVVPGLILSSSTPPVPTGGELWRGDQHGAVLEGDEGGRVQHAASELWVGGQGGSGVHGVGCRQPRKAAGHRI